MKVQRRGDQPAMSKGPVLTEDLFIWLCQHILGTSEMIWCPMKQCQLHNE